jgi:hypothetical protein
LQFVRTLYIEFASTDRPRNRADTGQPRGKLIALHRARPSPCLELSVRDQSLLNTVGIADALGTSRPTASRAAARGEYGKPVVRKGTRRKFYRLAAIEKAAGHKFTPDQLAKAKAAHDYTGPTVPVILRGFIALVLARSRNYPTQPKNHGVPK